MYDEHEMDGAGNRSVSSTTAFQQKGSDKKRNNGGKSAFSVRELTVIGLLAAITIALGVTGYGIIPLGPLNITVLHVPTLIGALVEGPKVGAFVGLIFGAYSLWFNMTAPNILSPLFINPFVSVFPRIIFPVLAYIVYRALWKVSQGPRLIISAFLGTVFHTVMVMGMIYVFYADMFAKAMNLSPDNVWNTILFLSLSHGIPEAVFAGLVVTPVVLALRKALRKDAPQAVKRPDPSASDAEGETK